MKTYKYQMHMHTKPCSLCAGIDSVAMVHAIKDGGYDGGVITNHIKHGNTGIDRNLPWHDFVKAYEDDYLLMKAEADKLDIDIIFGIEQGVCGNGQEILVYGITPQMLYDHPELDTNSIKVWYETLKPLGAVIIQAHPYRDRGYISDSTPIPEYIDGIEVINAGNFVNEDESAAEYAASKEGIITTSGGDAHEVRRSCSGGIMTARRITDGEILTEILTHGTYNLLEVKE